MSAYRSDLLSGAAGGGEGGGGGGKNRPTHLAMTGKCATMSAEHKKEVLRYVQELNAGRAASRKTVGGSLRSPGLREDLISPVLWEEMKSPFHKESLKSPGLKESLKSPGHMECVNSPGCRDDFMSPGHIVEPLKKCSIPARGLIQNELHLNFGSPPANLPNSGSPSGGRFNPLSPSSGGPLSFGSPCVGGPSPGVRLVDLPNGLCSPSPVHPSDDTISPRSHPKATGESGKRHWSPVELPPMDAKRPRVEWAGFGEGRIVSAHQSKLETVTSPSAFKWPPGGQVMDLSHLSVGEMEQLHRENAAVLRRQKFITTLIEQQLLKAKHGRDTYSRKLKYLVQPEGRVFEEPGASWLPEWLEAGGSRSPPAVNGVAGRSGGQLSLKPEDDLYAAYGKPR